MIPTNKMQGYYIYKVRLHIIFNNQYNVRFINLFNVSLNYGNTTLIINTLK